MTFNPATARTQPPGAPSEGRRWRVLDISHFDAKDIHLLRAGPTQHQGLTWGGRRRCASLADLGPKPWGA